MICGLGAKGYLQTGAVGKDFSLMNLLRCFIVKNRRCTLVMPLKFGDYCENLAYPNQQSLYFHIENRFI